MTELKGTFQGKNVLVIGSGVSGVAAAGLLSRLGAHPTVYDSRQEADVCAIQKKLSENAAQGEIPVVTGKLTDRVLESTEYMAVVLWFWSALA